MCADDPRSLLPRVPDPKTPASVEGLGSDQLNHWRVVAAAVYAMSSDAPPHDPDSLPSLFLDPMQPDQQWVQHWRERKFHESLQRFGSAGEIKRAAGRTKGAANSKAPWSHEDAQDWVNSYVAEKLSTRGRHSLLQLAEKYLAAFPDMGLPSAETIAKNLRHPVRQRARRRR